MRRWRARCAHVHAPSTQNGNSAGWVAGCAGTGARAICAHLSFLHEALPKSPEVFAALLRSARAVASRKQSMQNQCAIQASTVQKPVSYTHLRAHETSAHL
eukprot:10360713-Alexandrium_andersonii.AAC.1